MTDVPKGYTKHPVLGLIPLPSTVGSTNFEEKIVKRVLAVFSLGGFKNQIYERQERLSGYRRLTLDAFHLVIPSFPFYLRAHYVTKIKKNFDLLRCLKGHFKAQAPYKIYRAEKQSRPDEFRDMPFVVVIKWPFLNNGMVLHTRGDTGDDGFRMVFRVNSDKQAGGQVYCLEPFDQFLQAVRDRWTYGDND